MRRLLVSCLLVLSGTPVLAVPQSSDKKPTVPPLSKDEAERFALQLKTTIDLIVKQYARPVQRPDLLAAALKGLYEAAGTAVPTNLAAEAKRADDSDSRVVELIIRTRLRLGNAAPLKGDKALEVALWATLRALDPYCFLTIGDSYTRNTTNERDGVGLELEEGIGVGPLRVKAVTPGGPAQKAGLRPGDLITHLDGESLEGKSAVQTEATWKRLVEATRNNSFRLTVWRRGTKRPRKLTLEPRAFTADTVFGVSRNPDNSWNYFLDRKEKIAHIRLGSLKHGTAAELQRVIEGLQKEGLAGMILDLRWCPGGMLDEAVDVASLFVGDRPIATIDYRDGRKQSYSRRQKDFPNQNGNASFLDFPLVVLVNGETLGGGELIAAAIQDHKRGAIAGQRTVGKGSVQNTLMTEDRGTYNPISNMTVRLSIGIFTRSTGKNLQRFATSKPADDWGVRPDAKLEFKVSRELSRKLHELWQLQDLRPGSSNEALPMDDPANDAQRQFAARALRKMMQKEKK
jgi:C-terminal peptidase prc